jgi:hypothetical protein
VLKLFLDDPPRGWGFFLGRDISDVLVHRNPVKDAIDGDSCFDFDAVPCVCSFASPYLLRSLLHLHDSILAIDARNKCRAGTFRGGDDGNEFELLCLHGFKISGVEFLAHPLSNDNDDDVQATRVTFPPEQLLIPN